MKTITLTVGVPLSVAGNHTNEEIRLVLTTENYTRFRSKDLVLSDERLVHVPIRFNEVVANSIRDKATERNWTIVAYTGALLTNRG